MINIAFLKKEFREMIKTPKLVIILSVFLFFSIIGPLTAKYMNEIIATFASEIEINFPDPTHIQSWEQFYSNTTSISMIVFLIMMTGTVAQEKAKGSIYLVLTKNITRKSLLITKVFAAIILFTVIYILSILVSGYYTWFLFKEVFYDGLFISLLSIYILGIFFIITAVFLSVIIKSSTHAALIAFAVYAVLNIFTIASSINPYNPAGSSILVLNQLKTFDKTGDIWLNIIITAILSIGLCVFSIKIFKKQEL